MLRDQSETGAFDRSAPRTWRLLASFTLLGLTAAVATLRGPVFAAEDVPPTAPAKSPAATIHEPITPVYVPDGAAGEVGARRRSMGQDGLDHGV